MVLWTPEEAIHPDRTFTHGYSLPPASWEGVLFGGRRDAGAHFRSDLGTKLSLGNEKCTALSSGEAYDGKAWTLEFKSQLSIIVPVMLCSLFSPSQFQAPRLNK